ncbi:hypothetical protein [Stenotrophomonas sp. SY1]|jgi:hypothetical protein|uniref:hypothetical protein n=1 Tax=Stenotrophomonas sp. SY1 TaxID=477235 RepID=UPI001E3BA56F|nr:hypothetical protein [Stenotrophomonas sp. SY1]MCD9088580.1 hypothetical protein [Stenotrophomonas sp. SY1]
MYKRLLQVATAMLLLVAGVAQAEGPSRSQRSKLPATQEAYMAAVRWNDFEAAERFLDPQYLELKPITELQRERYRQVQVSAYRERSSNAGADGSIERRMEISVINRNTLAERTAMVNERWRWDAEAKRWWQAGGLPDLWQGQ